THGGAATIELLSDFAFVARCRLTAQSAGPLHAETPARPHRRRECLLWAKVPGTVLPDAQFRPPIRRRGSPDRDVRQWLPESPYARPVPVPASLAVPHGPRAARASQV